LKPVHHGEILLFPSPYPPITRDHQVKPRGAIIAAHPPVISCCRPKAGTLSAAEGERRSRESNDLIGEANLYGIREIQGKILP
jgi:hypothetical protein